MRHHEFFTYIFAHAPPDALVRWGPLESPLFLTLEELEDVQPSAQQDVFFGPAPRKDAVGTKEAVLGASVAWMDFDDTARHPRPLLPPSFIVRSGGGFHLYWLLDQFYPAETIEEINQTLIAHDHPGEGGTACWDATRVLRVPGTTNNKYNPPVSVVLLSEKPERVYTAEALLALEEYDRAILTVQSNETRSERDWRLCTLLYSWDVPKEFIEWSLLAYSEKAKSEGQHYIERTLEQAADSPAAAALKFTQALKNVLPKPGTKSPSLRKQRQEPLANFTVTPVARLVGPEGQEAGLQVAVEWDEGLAVLTATQQDFDGRRSVNRWLSANQLGSRAWLGTDKTAYKAWASLVENAPPREVLLVRQAGRYDLHGQSVFVYAQDAALVHPENDDDELGVSWTPQAPVPMEAAVDPITPVEDRTVAETLELMLQCYSETVLLPALGWVAATPLKPVIEKLRVRFPLLFLFGPKGSGKTTLLRDVLLPLVGMTMDPLGADVSRFALLAHLGMFNAWPTWVGEFRPTTQGVADLQMFLRMAYDGGRAERGRPDQSVAVYDLTAPVVMDGEALTTDAALRERCISVRLRQAVIKAGMPAYEAHEALTTMPHRDAIAAEFLRWTLRYDAKELDSLLTAHRQNLTADLPFGRLVNTASVVLLGLDVFNAFSKKVSGPVLGDAQIREAVLAAMYNTYTPGLGVTTAVDRFCEIVAHSFQEHQGWARGACVWDAEARVLWVNVTMTLHWVRRFSPDMPHRDLMLPQLEDRADLYIVGPERLVQKGGGEYYGIDIDAAQRLGLDVPEPTDVSIATPRSD